MITKSPDGQTLECNECGDDLGQVFREDEFLNMIGEARVAGWAIKLVDGAWVHYCPDCKTSEPSDRLAQARRLFSR